MYSKGHIYFKTYEMEYCNIEKIWILYELINRSSITEYQYIS